MIKFYENIHKFMKNSFQNILTLILYKKFKLDRKFTLLDYFCFVFFIKLLVKFFLDNERRGKDS